MKTAYRSKAYTHTLNEETQSFNERFAFFRSLSLSRYFQSNFNSRISIGNWHALAIFTTRTTDKYSIFSNLKIISYHANFLEHFWAISREICSAYHFRNFSIFDSMSEVHFKNKISTRSIHLTSPKCRNIETVFDACDNIFRRVRTIVHIGITHSYNGFVHVRFTTSMSIWG